MKKLKDALKLIRSFLDPIFELAIYIAIAFYISEFVKITFIQAITIVFIYFILDLARSSLKKS